MSKYIIPILIGAITGSILGYLILYKIIGCTTGSCPIRSNPYIATLIGAIMGILIAIIVVPTTKTEINKDNPQTPAIQYKKITAKEAKEIIDNNQVVIIVDVRTEAEYLEGHIPEAILIPNETITNKKPELLPELDALILVYCRSGNRSAQAAKKLIAIGYTNVYDFGGIVDWPYEIVVDK